LVSLTDFDIIRLVRIENVIEETPTIRTIVFEDEPSISSFPGQFLMVWVPLVEELPMSIMIDKIDNRTFAAVTVKKYGSGSTALYDKGVGEQIGIRGPYGNSFSVPSAVRNALVVGGGTGLVPLLRLCETLRESRVNITLVMGSRTRNEMLFEERARQLLLDTNLDNKLEVSTDDGTYGFKGSAVKLAELALKSGKFEIIYTCGPELMMKGIYELGEIHSVPVKASLERYMKCAVGVCGSCCINDKLVCRDGTIFGSADLRQLSEFGFSYRDKSGRLTYFHPQGSRR
jgi:dihydroorotate dehydrogenase electron transfer subunit